MVQMELWENCLPRRETSKKNILQNLPSISRSLGCWRLVQDRRQPKVEEVKCRHREKSVVCEICKRLVAMVVCRLPARADDKGVEDGEEISRCSRC